MASHMPPVLLVGSTICVVQALCYGRGATNPYKFKVKIYVMSPYKFKVRFYGMNPYKFKVKIYVLNYKVMSHVPMVMVVMQAMCQNDVPMYIFKFKVMI